MSKKTRRARHEPAKVWHNPEVMGVRRPSRPAAAGTQGTSSPPAPEARSSTALPVPRGRASERGARDPSPRSGRIVAPVSHAKDEREAERERLLGKLRLAEGRPAITRAANELFKDGFVLPEEDQLVHLQLLEHSDETHVRDAIAHLATILDQEPPKRFTVLDSRLRRLEELADEPETRAAAAELRRRTKPPREASA